jgi:hypothetical protein
VHCRTEAEAQEVRAAIAARMRECGLELHPEKTKIVYCKDDNRWGRYPNEKFDFLGYTFRPRRSKSREEIYFIGFGPAVSDKAVKAIRAEIRSWNLHLRSDKAIEDLSRMFNPIVRGWLQYYGVFTGRRSIRRCGNWIDLWPAGPTGNTRSCVDICAGRHIGSRACRGGIPRCGRTGRWVCGEAPWREPYERRRSRTVLREPRGEIPRGYSPRDSQSRPSG